MKTHAMDASTLADVAEALPPPAIADVDADEDHPELPWRARGRLPLPVWLSIVVPSVSMVLALLLASAVDALPRAGVGATRVAVSCDAPPASATGAATGGSGCRRSAVAGAPAR